VHEQAVVTVAVGGRQALAVDRNDRLALLAGRLGDQLLDPGADVPQRRRGHQRELVPPELRGLAEHDAEPHRGVGGRGDVRGEARVIASALSSSGASSTPLAAAGTSPKSESTE
jgi:hypothetical protein